MATNTEATLANGTEWKGDLNMLKTEGETIIRSALFIMFAEYMGFISKFLELAEQWCQGKKPENHICKLIEIDAFNVFNEMKKKYQLEEIKNYFNEFYSIVLEEYDKELTKIEESEKKSDFLDVMEKD